MEDVLDSIRRIISHWLITTVQLTANAQIGDQTITIRSTKRFREGDEFLINNDNGIAENYLYVEEVVDDYTLRLTEPLRFNWSVADNAAVMKTVYGQYLKDVFIGEPANIKDFPAVTVNGAGRSSEWYTIRATKERYNIEIGVYIQEGNQDDSMRYIYRMADLIQAGLKKNIYPLVNSYNSTTLTADIAVNDTTIHVADTSVLLCGQMILVEDPLKAEPNVVKTIIDSTTIEVTTRFKNTFDTSDTTVIRPKRYVYNSWPADVKYGTINKGTLLKAAVVSFFVEETEIQGEGGWQDTQLT